MRFGIEMDRPGRSTLLCQLFRLCPQCLDSLDVFAQAFHFARDIAGLQHRANSNAQFNGINRFPKKIVRSHFDGLFQPVMGIKSRQKDYRDGVGRRIRTQFITGLQAIHFGHANIEQDEVGMLGGRCDNRSFAIGRREDLIPFVFQENRQKRTNVGIVIHHQNSFSQQDAHSTGLD